MDNTWNVRPRLPVLALLLAITLLMLSLATVMAIQPDGRMLAKIVSVVSGEKTNIKNVEAETFDAQDAKIRMVLSVADRKQMERVIRSIRRIRGVREVERILR